jgi:hypothetical protein
MLRVRAALVALVALLIIPVAAHAQTLASITGVARDTSGAVLPGVTVEAASPALIEKVRVVVTDSNGQYRIEQLRPCSTSCSRASRSTSAISAASTATSSSPIRI